MMKANRIALSTGFLMLAAAALPATAQAAGDPVKGKAVFARCAACHTVEPGKNRLGPTLAGVVGRKSAAVPGYNYSPALKASGMVWNQANLDKFLLNPRTAVPGTKMIFGGLPNPADRANVIAYMAKPVK